MMTMIIITMPMMTVIIGVRGIEEAHDEYDSYATPVLELLERAAPDEEVGAYLTYVEVERMGLKPHKDNNEDVAALLRELHALGS